MKNILLMISSKKDRELISKYLESKHMVLIPDNPDDYDNTIINDTSFDVLVADIQSLSVHRGLVKSLKECSSPFRVPVLLTGISRKNKYEIDFFRDIIDEVLFFPFSPLEFNIRLDSLFKIITLQKKAVIDPLTDVFRREHIVKRGREELSRMKRSSKKTSFGLIMLDIDYFKEINDSYGHHVGDKVLKEFSLRMQRCLREYDIIGRYGGEEFLVFLPDTDEEGTKRAAERLQNEIVDEPFYINDKEIVLSASFGITSCDNPDENIQDVIKQADYALYEAKRNGRNQIVLEKCTLKKFD
ncbi:diguanylate cyclase [Flexistipes sinusarabici DSM 4947]|uniref:diguanylate cyclase n=1 Tax=Flexistipes sinusarabici (strain ATCC 49648 / DSM 4947 / MAS 10) TaxID=717231 RepID=F8E748_FLESM|nr:GGDEF domain-containing protein [Flexistipes sinusarabici]AEI14911.1 diguanylate cyclase [Flexistipes sinusarabici DSM 4947]